MNLQSLVKAVFYRCGYSVKRLRPARTLHGAALNGSSDVMALLHHINPYIGFEAAEFTSDVQGWGGDSPAFRTLIERLRPTLIVEVGTWKGASALEMARLTKELELPSKILCVDTWLGALEFWADHTDANRYLSLRLRHGYPSVYYQFLANVCHAGMQDRIIPFPQTASTAALWLRQQGIQADLIYVDASHEEEDVFQDVTDYWESVRSGGILFGDDYAGWDGVRMAVDRFAAEQKTPVRFASDKWYFEKP